MNEGVSLEINFDVVLIFGLDVAERNAYWCGGIEEFIDVVVLTELINKRIDFGLFWFDADAVSLVVAAMA